MKRKLRWCIWTHRCELIDYVEMFRGMVTHSSGYPRVVVKDALAKSSSALLLVHCHPSGSVQPSQMY